ncbi:hypothetical protein D3C72_1962940 [compost metagenome]
MFNWPKPSDAAATTCGISSEAAIAWRIFTFFSTESSVWNSSTCLTASCGLNTDRFFALFSSPTSVLVIWLASMAPDIRPALDVDGSGTTRNFTSSTSGRLEPT